MRAGAQRNRDSLATITRPYGVASKAANGLVQASCERFGLRGLPGNVIFRKFATSAGAKPSGWNGEVRCEHQARVWILTPGRF